MPQDWMTEDGPFQKGGIPMRDFGINGQIWIDDQTALAERRDRGLAEKFSNVKPAARKVVDGLNWRATGPFSMVADTPDGLYKLGVGVDGKSWKVVAPNCTDFCLTDNLGKAQRWAADHFWSRP